MNDTSVYITIRVVPTDTDKPITEAETGLLFRDGQWTEAERRDIVGNAARTLYPRAASVRIPTPPQEGGR